MVPQPTKRSVSQARKRLVIAKYMGICANYWNKCPFKKLVVEECLIEIDHIIPLWAGGTNHISNLQLLCSTCHKRKTKFEEPEQKMHDYIRKQEELLKKLFEECNSLIPENKRKRIYAVDF